MTIANKLQLQRQSPREIYQGDKRLQNNEKGSRKPEKISSQKT